MPHARASKISGPRVVADKVKQMGAGFRFGMGLVLAGVVVWVGGWLLVLLLAVLDNRGRGVDHPANGCRKVN